MAKLLDGTSGTGFFWTGNTGSRSTGKAFAEQYNRARHYSSTTKQWITRDPLWPDEHAYGYVRGNPVSWIDPVGTQLEASPTELLGLLICCKDQAQPAIDAATAFCKKYKLPGNSQTDGLCNAMQHCMWACLTAQKCFSGNYSGVYVAKLCTDIHEKDAPFPKCPGYRQPPDPYKPNDPRMKCMDLYNNAVGINCSSAGDCYQCCLAHIKSGDVQVVDPPGKLPPTWKHPKTGCKTDPGHVKFPEIILPQ